MRTPFRVRPMVREHWPFLLALSAIVLSRLWFAVTFPVVQISDYEAYYNEARGFAGLIEPHVSALNAIGPKLVFAVWFRLVGDSLTGIGIANTFLYATSLCLAYAGTRRIFGRTTATLVVWIGFFSLSELYFINLVSSEVLGGLFIAALYYVISLGSLSWSRTVLVGVITGFAVYNRSNILPIAALVLVNQLLYSEGLRRAMAKAFVAQLVTLVAVLPLCFYNLSKFGRFTPLIANAEALWYGNNPKLSGDFHAYTKVPEDYPVGSAERAALRREFASFYTNPDPEVDFSRLNPYEVGDVKVRYALAWIASEPVRYLSLIRARFQFLFFACTYGEVPYRYYDLKNPAQPRWRPAHQRLMERVRMPVRSLYQFLIGSALAGLILTILRRGPLAFLRSPQGAAFLLLVYYAIPFLLTAAANRYHIPVLTLAWVYLAHGVVLLGSGLRARIARGNDTGSAGAGAPANHRQSLPPTRELHR